MLCRLSVSGQELAYRVGGVALPRPGRAITFLVEWPCHLLAREALAAQLADSPQQLRVVPQGLIARHRAHDRMACRQAATPRDLDLRPCTVGLHPDHDTPHQQPDYLLALGGGRLRG